MLVSRKKKEGIVTELKRQWTLLLNKSFCSKQNIISFNWNATSALPCRKWLLDGRIVQSAASFVSSIFTDSFIVRFEWFSLTQVVPRPDGLKWQSISWLLFYEDSDGLEKLIVLMTTKVNDHWLYLIKPVVTTTCGLKYLPDLSLHWFV